MAATATGRASRTSSQPSRYVEPKLRVARPYELTHAERVKAFAAGHGVSLLAWQGDMLADMAAVDGGGQFVHRRFGASIPRQAGKSSDVIEWVAYLACVMGMRVLYTAHNYSTTCEMRRRFRDIFGAKPKDPHARHPQYNREVSFCNNNTGQEAIEFASGGVIAFSTRTKSATLGYSFDVIVYDEAQELTGEQVQAILPTFTSGAAKNPQEILVGTPKRPNSFGTEFEPMREEAHDAPKPDLGWWEYGADEVGDIGDESRWYEVNPSLSEGLASIEAIRTARNMLDRDEASRLRFAQEFLGYWLPKMSASDAAIDAGAWDACATASPPESGKTVFAVKYALDGSAAALAACRRASARDVPHVEVVAYRTSAGSTWLADFAERARGTAAGFVVDGGGNGRDLRDEMRRRGLPARAVVDPGAKGVAAASAKFMNALAERAVTHFDQPALNACAMNVKKRMIGRSGYGFDGIGGNDPTMLEACALALWGIDEIKRDPGRKQRIG